MRIGAIEMGGTKMILAVGDENGKIIDRCRIPTTLPEETISKMVTYFKDKNIEALGIASFGPVDLNRESKTYGYITTTPKPGWANTDVIGAFRDLRVPVGFDTDVNAACLGEVTFGAGRGLKNVLYGTIGTGIGFGVYADGHLLHGMLHTETGHMLLQRRSDDENFEGPCPYHQNCLETLASGPAIEKRWHKKAEDLTDNPKVWELEAYYLGQACSNCVLCYSPERIILGGGVMHNERLLEMVRVETLKNLNGYIQKDEILKNMDHYIVYPELKDDAGILGAFELARKESLCH